MRCRSLRTSVGAGPVSSSAVADIKRSPNRAECLSFLSAGPPLANTSTRPREATLITYDMLQLLWLMLTRYMLFAAVLHSYHRFSNRKFGSTFSEESVAGWEDRRRPAERVGQPLRRASRVPASAAIAPRFSRSLTGRSPAGNFSSPRRSVRPTSRSVHPDSSPRGPGHSESHGCGQAWAPVAFAAAAGPCFSSLRSRGRKSASRWKIYLPARPRCPEDPVAAWDLETGRLRRWPCPRAE
jgi:hypothetical protein